MSRLRRRVETRLRDEICTRCRQAAGVDACDYQSESACPLVMRVDDLIEVVGQVSDYSLEPYQEKVREVIRSAEHHRHRGDCALDEHFPRIVTILEQEFKADPDPA